MNYFELELANNLDDGFSNATGGGGRGGFGGGRPMGGGFGGGRPMGGSPMRTPSMPRPTAPSTPPRTRSSSPTAPTAPSTPPRTRSSSPTAPTAPRTRTPQQQHNRMVRRFYRGYNPYPNWGYRRFGITPYGRRWWLGGYGYLFGYPYEFLYPLFYDLETGVYDEELLKQKYNISDEDWNDLIDKLVRGKYITFDY